jgi:hypothetical protein
MGGVLEMHYCALSTGFNRTALYIELEQVPREASKINCMVEDSLKLLDLLHRFSFPDDEFRNRIENELGGSGWLLAFKYYLESALLSINECWDKGFGREDPRFRKARVQGRAFFQATYLQILREAEKRFPLLNE